MHKNNTIKLLGLQDKNIILNKTEINSKEKIANFYISKKLVACSCPCCKTLTKRIHDHRSQKIKHIPINGYKTFLILDKIRFVCPNCNKKFYMNYNNIVNPRFRCSNELFNKIISDFQSTSMNFKEVAKYNFVSSNVVTRYIMFFRYLMGWSNVSLLPKHISIDEFKGNCDGSKYLFHVFDLDTGNTIQILKTRKFDDIVAFFNTIENRNEVEVITMDLYSPFKNAVQAKLKKAVIVADRFHYTRIVANALDSFRIEIWRNAKGSEKKYFKYLKRSLLKDIESVPKDKILELEEKLNYAFEISGELKYAYQLYQNFLRIKDGASYKEKCKRFSDWLDDALSSTLEPFKSAAETLLKWNNEILNSFKYKYTNSSTEGKNNKINVIKRISYGFRNLENFTTMIKLKDCKI